MAKYGTSRLRGRPKKNTVQRVVPEMEVSQLTKIIVGDKEKMEDIIPDRSQDPITLNWVGEHRTHKTKWESEDLYRERFLRGEFKVRSSIAMDRNQLFIKYNEEGDIEYKPF